MPTNVRITCVMMLILMCLGIFQRERERERDLYLRDKPILPSLPASHEYARSEMKRNVKADARKKEDGFG